jgi:hypothetical protein
MAGDYHQEAYDTAIYIRLNYSTIINHFNGAAAAASFNDAGK